MLPPLTSCVHPANWLFGWAWVLAGFVSGAVLGTGFHREKFLGGYASFPRRLVRLGHICFVALGLMNVLFALSPVRVNAFGSIASASFIAGAVLMPANCFLAAAWPEMRKLFVVPVLALMTAVIFTLIGGLS